MFCTIEIIAVTAKEAEERATEAFTEFFGTEDFKISESSAESDAVLMSGHIVSYKCKFSARLAPSS